MVYNLSNILTITNNYVSVKLHILLDNEIYIVNIFPNSILKIEDASVKLDAIEFMKQSIQFRAK